MRILHTADWHIGQLFHEYDRTWEHQQFLKWLLQTLRNEAVDVLLISGDVFDISNPSAASIKMFYGFLSKAVRENPDLQIIVTAGNHDSASRIESPKPLLENLNIHIIGIIDKDESGKIDYENIIVPIRDKAGNVKAWCMAAPFLRMGDYPQISDCKNPYAEGVTAFYKDAMEMLLQKRKTGQAIIAMGHLHTQNAEAGDMYDKKEERMIMGGVECISASAFHEGICYVALGHIHKAQRIGGKEHIRYSGSPLPLSFSEHDYTHQVILFDLEGENIQGLRSVEVPISVPLLREPKVHSLLPETISRLEGLEPFSGPKEAAPYLEVRILLEGPEPGLRHKVEKALAGKNYRLARIDTRYKKASNDAVASAAAQETNLQEMKPVEVLQKAYLAKYHNEMPPVLLSLFEQVAQELNETD